MDPFFSEVQLARLGTTSSSGRRQDIDRSASTAHATACGCSCTSSSGRSRRNLDLTLEAWHSLADPRPELWLFGIEPELAQDEGIRYFTRPSDAEVNELLSRSSVFLQTSRHEGFCLPLLEAMAAGTPVVCTDADGNRDFCVDRVNCLLVEPDPSAVAAALIELLSSPELRRVLVEGGRRTASEFEWERNADRLERFFLALPSRAGTAVPTGAHD